MKSSYHHTSKKNLLKTKYPSKTNTWSLVLYVSVEELSLAFGSESDKDHSWFCLLLIPLETVSRVSYLNGVHFFGGDVGQEVNSPNSLNTETNPNSNFALL